MELRSYLQWKHWRDKARTLDPEGANFWRATRATLAAIAASFFLFHAVRWFHQPETVAFVGIFIAVLGSVLVNDPKASAQRGTMLIVSLVASATLALGTLVAPIWWLNNLVFVAIIFGAVFVRQFGPRYLALGFIAFLSYFVSLFFRAKFADLPWLVAGIAVGVIIAYVLQFWLLPNNPKAKERQAFAAYRAQLRRLATQLRTTIERGQWSAAEPRALRTEVARLNNLALAWEHAMSPRDQAASLSGPRSIRLWVLDLEVALEGMVDASGRLLESGETTPELRATLAESLGHVLGCLEEEDFCDKSVVHCGEVGAQLESLGRAAGRLKNSAALIHFGHSLRDFGRALARRDEHTHSPVLDVAAASEAENEDSAAPKQKLRFRLALQASLAGALAIAAGELISRERWYWSVIAAFFVFAQTETSSETLVKAWQRIFGTLIGVIVGLALGEAVIGYAWLQIVLIYVCIFFAYLLFGISYAWMIFWFTLLISVLYSWLGLLTPGLLELRLLLTIVGAVVGVLSARFIFPARTGEKVRTAALAVLQKCADLLELAGRGQSTLHALAGEMRTLDTKLQEMRAAADPLRRRFLPVEGREQVGLAHSVDVIAFSARQLIGLWPDGEGGATPLAGVVRQLSENTRALMAALEHMTSTRLERAVPAFDDPIASTLEVGEVAEGRLRHWLRRIDRELRTMAELT